LSGYSVDMGKKGKSVAFMRDKNSFVYQDSKLFDFIPFAFSKTREAFFVNNNFSIDQLLHSNKNDLLNEEHTARSQLFFKLQNSSSFIDYDVEVIKKEREKDHFETIFVRKEAIRIFEKISNETIAAISKPCNAKKSENGQDLWLTIENEVTGKVLNSVKLDDLIERLLKASNSHNYLLSHLIKINQMIYREDDSMNDKQRRAYASAMEVKSALKGRENKIRAYEQRLISAITIKDYEKVQTVLLHLSSFTQVKMDFLIDLFEDFESNKNLAYTFINVLGEKKDFKPKTNNGEDQNGK
jgi:CRISPR-associated protein Cst1